MSNRSTRGIKRGWSWTWERQDGRIYRSAHPMPTARAASFAAFNSWFENDLGRVTQTGVAGVSATMLSHPTRGPCLMLQVYESEVDGGGGWVPIRVEDPWAFWRTVGLN
jgi:hypothetical protein